MENRTLRIDQDKPRFKYQYEKCKKLIGIRYKCKIVTEYFDFTDTALRSKLKNMGFKLKVTK